MPTREDIAKKEELGEANERTSEMDMEMLLARKPRAKNVDANNAECS
jgi:hypothetical protein